uniref:Uncharacterized protein n=1 Tax=Sphaeramia orbicularis TaxID=375764 RepID=A0A673BVA3_9TELE
MHERVKINFSTTYSTVSSKTVDTQVQKYRKSGFWGKNSSFEKYDLLLPLLMFLFTGANRELSMLLSKFAEVLSERASADTVEMKQLEGILTEAQNLESFLKGKKSHLRQTLALISDKLKG